MLVRLIARRLVIGLATLMAVSVLIFAAVEALPGDVATAMLGQAQTPEAVQAIRDALGLDRQPLARYGDWLGGIVTGDLGKSLASQRDIGPEFRWRLGNTLFLAASAAAIAVPVSLLLGIGAAISEGRFVDRAVNIAALVTISVPEFLIGYVMIIALAVHAGWFPSLAMVSADMTLGERIHATALPVASLVLVVLAHIMRLTKAAIMGVLASPYIEMAILKGVPRWQIVVRHALPNALAPIITVVSLNLAYLVVGVVVVEVVFVYPGLGQLMVDSVAKRDVPVVQTCGLLFASVYVLLNMIADILAIATNPRLRFPR